MNSHDGHYSRSISTAIWLWEVLDPDSQDEPSVFVGPEPITCIMSTGHEGDEP